MLMSTLKRCLQATDLYKTSFNDVQPQVRRDFARELANVSQIVERYTNVALQVDTFTEALAPCGNVLLFPINVPIRSITELVHDPMCMFGNTGYTLLSQGNDYTIAADKRRVCLVTPYPQMFPPPAKPYRLTYKAGVAYNTDVTKYFVAETTGSPVPGTYTQSSGLSIIITDITDGVVTFIPDIGTFDTGDVIDCTSGTITLGEVIEESIINNFPSLEDAVIKQVCYGYERRKSVGKHSTTTGNAQTTYMGEYQVLQILKDACDMFQNYKVGF